MAEGEAPNIALRQFKAPTTEAERQEGFGLSLEDQPPAQPLAHKPSGLDRVAYGIARIILGPNVDQILAEKVGWKKPSQKAAEAAHDPAVKSNETTRTSGNGYPKMTLEAEVRAQDVTIPPTPHIPKPTSGS